MEGAPHSKSEAKRLAVQRGGTLDDADMPTMTCPGCGKEEPDYDGFGVVFCAACGFCRHLSLDDGTCNYCGAEPLKDPAK